MSLSRNSAQQPLAISIPPDNTELPDMAFELPDIVSRPAGSQVQQIFHQRPSVIVANPNRRPVDDAELPDITGIHAPVVHVVRIPVIVYAPAPSSYHVPQGGFRIDDLLRH